MKFLTLFFLITLIFASHSQAKDCSSINALKTIEEGESEGLTYRFLEGTENDLPVVVYIPGGPGDDSIQANEPRFTSQYGYIQTDPRGVGCNSHLYDPSVNLSSEDVAQDIVNIIKEEGLESYIIYGTSYGTIPATIASHFIEERADMPDPQSVVLQATLGRAFQEEEEDQGIIEVWNDYKRQSPMASFLRGSDSDFDYSSYELGQTFKSLLAMGVSPKAPHQKLLDLVLKKWQEGEKQDLKTFVEQSTQPLDDELVRLYRQIGCEEISILGWQYDVFYENGDLVLKDSERQICEGFSFQEGYDSADYPIASPIYYFNGLKDPATPYWQAEYHINHQKTALKNVVNVKEGGHYPLDFNLDDCSFYMWQQIVMNREIEQDYADQHCTLETEVKTVLAE